MPRNGSGTMVRAAASEIVSGTTITKTWGDAMASDYIVALTASIANDGQTPILANLPMSTYRHTGVGNASARTDYAAAGQVQDSGFLWGGTAGGTADALTITLTPAITAYATGQRFYCISSASPNATTTPTIAINGLATKTFLRRSGAAIVAGDIPASTLIEFVYNGTNMLLLNVLAITGATTITTVGTVTTGVWNATVIGAAYGGTGVANNAASTITISGNFASTFTVTGVTAVTFPTSGTLLTTTGTAATTNALQSATTTVNVSAATAPSSGQVLTATGASAATWQTPSGGITSVYADAAYWMGV